MDKSILRNDVLEREMESTGTGQESFYVSGEHGSEHLGTLKTGNM
jgi:hypothetical protein